MSTLWQKDDTPAADRSFFHEFTTAEDRRWDHLLLPYDILVNIAQARMLERIGTFEPAESDEVITCLRELYQKWEEDSFTLSEDDEDAHSVTEKALTAQIGEAGERIHTGRSRNDQVLADVNLALKTEIRSVASLILETISQLERIAGDHQGVFFAGTTHTQPAMPTSADAWAAGYIRLLLNDLDSLKHAYRQVDVCPLGSAAGYGVPHIPVDREYICEQLGFSELLVEVNAAQLTRVTSVLRLADALEYAALTFNRMAADVIDMLRGGLITLSDNQTSGSSIMPQKRNPDLWELIRSCYHRLSGSGRELRGIAANLTSGYHRDLQPIKAVILDALNQTRSATKATTFGLQGLQFHEKNCASSITPEVMATHHANNLVNEGIPFRRAYRQTAQDLQQISVPGSSALKASYAHTGAPGNYPEEAIRNEQAQFKEWLASEEQKWQDVLNNLLDNSSHLKPNS